MSLPLTEDGLLAVPRACKEEDAQMEIEALLSDHGDLRSYILADMQRRAHQTRQTFIKANDSQANVYFI